MSNSTPMRASSGQGPIPTWMKTVDKETLYNAESPASSEQSSPVEEAPAASPSNGTSEGMSSTDDSSSLRQELALAMADPSDIPTPDPDLQPTPAGYVRTDLDQQLEKAVAVLTSRYSEDVPRSLILEFALQQTLLQLREQGDESPLVEWLDATLSRS